MAERHRRRGCAAALIALFAACRTSSNAVPTPGAGVIELDSLSVNRGACYGVCGVDQMMIRRDGPTTVLNVYNIVAEVLIPRKDARQMLADAVAAGVLTLPPVIRADSALCPLEATDHATITLIAYRAGQQHRVEHYTGCYATHDLRVVPALARLVLFERQLPTLATRKQ